MVDDVEYLRPIKFRRNPSSGWEEEKMQMRLSVCLSVLGKGGHIYWQGGHVYPKKPTWLMMSSTCFDKIFTSVASVAERSNMWQPLRDQAVIFVEGSTPKHIIGRGRFLLSSFFKFRSAVAGK